MIDQAEKTCDTEICQRIDTEGMECIPENVSKIAYAECVYDESTVLLENYNTANDSKYSCEDYN